MHWFLQSGGGEVEHLAGAPFGRRPRFLPLPSGGGVVACWKESVTSLSSSLEHDAAVHQAQRMVAAQVGRSMEQALALMINTADAAEVTLELLAAEVIDRRVRFDPT